MDEEERDLRHKLADVEVRQASIVAEIANLNRAFQALGHEFIDRLFDLEKKLKIQEAEG